MSLLEERGKAPGDRDPAILTVPSMFQAARMIADTLREVIATHENEGQEADSVFGAKLVLGGQIAGGQRVCF